MSQGWSEEKLERFLVEAGREFKEANPNESWEGEISSAVQVYRMPQRRARALLPLGAFAVAVSAIVLMLIIPGPHRPSWQSDGIQIVMEQETSINHSLAFDSEPFVFGGETIYFDSGAEREV